MGVALFGTVVPVHGEQCFSKRIFPHNYHLRGTLPIWIDSTADLVQSSKLSPVFSVSSFSPPLLRFHWSIFYLSTTFGWSDRSYVSGHRDRVLRQTSVDRPKPSAPRYLCKFMRSCLFYRSCGVNYDHQQRRKPGVVDVVEVVEVVDGNCVTIPHPSLVTLVSIACLLYASAARESS